MEKYTVLIYKKSRFIGIEYSALFWIFKNLFNLYNFVAHPHTKSPALKQLMQAS